MNANRLLAARTRQLVAAVFAFLSIVRSGAPATMQPQAPRVFADAPAAFWIFPPGVMLGLPLDQHITNVIRFMRERADALGLRGTL